MHKAMEAGKAISGLTVGWTASARERGAAKLTPLWRQVVGDMPGGGEQEVRVLHARLGPGDVTPRHSHRFPVTLYMLEGAFTLELDGREPVTVRAGESFVEPPHVAMTGRNPSEDASAAMVLFYVSTPDAPFADLAA